ncbi:hypothetical protein [Anabaena azotica]|uniref:Uncharacterized protein n=1 Tax=Anabaena azotica FACHB-119 TaxID=947527 RepID=A0ABR8DC77_9NOST|nr:hypothetical protein [Anabaena azotica]MBD2503960.1 hypothetical protein [Anabaena azotica FACHB-119]
MSQTDVGDNLPLFEDIELEMPCYVLFFPKGAVKSASSKAAYINYLIVCHQELDLPEFKHVISWGCLDSNDQWIFSSKRIRRDGTIQASAFSTDDEEQQQRTLEIRNIVLQSILLLQYYADEMVHEMTAAPGKEKAFSQKARTPSEFRLPRWLGEEKKYRRTSGVATGTASGKSPHYRRWHWRVQRYGEGFSKTKVIKIKPIWVRGGND